MKGNKHGIRRILAILLSIMLFAGSLGITACAEEFTDIPMNLEEGFEDGSDEQVTIGDVSASENEEPAEEEELPPDEDMSDSGDDQDVDEDSFPDDQAGDESPVINEEPFAGDPVQEDSQQVDEDSFPDDQAGDESWQIDEEPFADDPVQEDSQQINEELPEGDQALEVDAQPADEDASGIETGAEDQPVNDVLEVQPETAAFDQSKTVNGVVVTVEADPGVFPADAVLSVETIPVYQQEQADAAVDEVRDEGQNVAVSYTFDIKVIDPETGEEYQPAEGQTVRVSFVLAEVADDNLETQVYHIAEDETTGELTAESLDVNTETTPETGEETTAVVETDGFSIYTVEFTYNNLEYVLPGNTSVSMSEILSTVGLTGEVTAVEISDESLFSASNETGEWIVTAHQAFSTTEWMKVTINDVVYEVTVTDTDGVLYIERSWDGTKVVEETKYADNVTPVPSDGKMTSGWYYLSNDVKKDGRVESIKGDVYLILGDGKTLDVKGLYVPSGSTLTIYGQTNGTGKIYTHPGGGAGIGGYSGHDNGNIVIHGGTIQAKGADHCAAIGSNDDREGGSITIYGGTVTANGGSYGAGIGGGRYCSGGNITIYGGTIKAIGGKSDGAAIGGGEEASGGNITIYGGTITANDPDDCNECGAGIGGGDKGYGGNITINGGDITVYSRDGAGIGGGDERPGGVITINGGTINAYKVNEGWGARIGDGAEPTGGNYTGSTITINGGTIDATGGKGACIGGGYKCYGGTVNINGGNICVSGKYGIGNGESAQASLSVYIGYTNATMDSICIYSSSYNGNVTLTQKFGNYPEATMSYPNDLFYEGVVSDNNKLKNGYLKPWDGSVYNWEMLQIAIDSASVGTTIPLDDTIYGGVDKALSVVSNKNLIIDLNGHDIDRNLTSGDAQYMGSVIRNEGTLAIVDSKGGGKITGGNS